MAGRGSGVWFAGTSGGVMGRTHGLRDAEVGIPCSRAGAASPLAFPGVLGSCQSLGLCQSLPVAQCRPSSGLLWEMGRFGHHGQGLSLGSCAGGHPRESVLLQREKRQWSWSPAGELSEILSFHGAEDVPFFAGVCWTTGFGCSSGI